MKKTGLQKRIFEGLFIMLFIRLLLFPSGRSFFFRLTLHELSTLYDSFSRSLYDYHIESGTKKGGRCAHLDHNFFVQFSEFFNMNVHIRSGKQGLHLLSLILKDVYVFKVSQVLESEAIPECPILEVHGLQIGHLLCNA